MLPSVCGEAYTKGMEEPLYSIVFQRHTTRANPHTLVPEEGMEVGFQYGEPKVQGQVFVPGELPDPAAIRTAILDYVNRGLQVQSLTE
jgi:hypothetical protein